MSELEATRRIIEAILCDYEPDFNPPGLVVVERPDRLFWCSRTNSLYANRVVRAAFSEDSADDGIAEIMEFFLHRRKSFSWWVGPSSAPASLGQKLRERGLEQIDSYEGLALFLAEEAPIRPHTDVTVRVAETELDVREIVRVSARVWGYGAEDQERMVQDRMAYLKLPGRRGGYLLARLSGQTAGAASFRYSSTGEALYLTGAATLPEFRGRGVFTELVRWRVEEARRRGCRLVATLARVGTSMPILTKLGFRRFFSLPVYAWRHAPSGG